MVFELTAAALPVADRVDAIHAAVCSGVLPVEIRWDRPASDIELDFALAVAGPLVYNRARSSDNALWRTARQARSDHEPQVFLAVQSVGSAHISQGERRVVLRPGDMTVYDTTKPYTITNVGTSELLYFQLPRSLVALPQSVLEGVLAVRIGGDNNPLADVALSYLTALGRGYAWLDPRAADLVATPTIELVRAVIAAHHGGDERCREPLFTSLALRVKRYVADHLGDRDLTPDSIAAAHHVSVRHLYQVMARDGVRLSASIREQRLEACRRDLRNPRRASHTVAAVGARWGFADASHFGRVFKAAYGTTPHDWRAGHAGHSATDGWAR
ncbi:hypothetical protein GCM10007304_26850 [Rhodococcoides trifolii]|uniref:HTH araC/xylS-type domain-containing protein n=1 Tax=Rhodococcoides trifolii TaxID=908250 RepID=A0A917FXI2_9NOCA|nr:helix-turn-helix domain-containing protein [Rhodococcus trifolii]GGG11447.1 hypothetical protein GCM10007304_26850 [Rhodococcus trifolii]